MMLRGFLTVDAGECVSRHQQKSDFYMRSNILHVFSPENTALKMKDSTRVWLVFMKIETWSLNCLTALTYDDGFFSWLWDKETGKDNHLNSMQESWGKWRIVSKDFFYSLLLLTQWNARIWWWAAKFLFQDIFFWILCKIDLHVVLCCCCCCFKTSFEFLSKCYHVLWVPKQSPWEIVRGEIWINSHLHANSTF